MDPFEPKRILCPIDFSGHSAQALRLAGSMAQSFSSELIVLHAQRLEAPAYFTQAQIADLKSRLRRSARAARALTEEFSSRYLPGNVPRSISVVEADPLTAILETLKKSKAGLLVMGTYGRSGLTRIRLGSVTESVLRRADVPVATAGPQIKALASAKPIRRVLAAVDYSEHAREVLNHAATVAARAGAGLIVTHVSPAGEGDAPDADLLRTLCDWVDPETRSRCQVSENVRRGTPAQEIIAAAQQHRASLIVAGTVRHRFWGSVHLGRATEAIVRSAPCPVLSVPE